MAKKKICKVSALCGHKKLSGTAIYDTGFMLSWRFLFGGDGSSVNGFRACFIGAMGNVEVGCGRAPDLRTLVRGVNSQGELTNQRDDWRTYTLGTLMCRTSMYRIVGSEYFSGHLGVTANREQPLQHTCQAKRCQHQAVVHRFHLAYRMVFVNTQDNR